MPFRDDASKRLPEAWSTLKTTRMAARLWLALGAAALTQCTDTDSLAPIDHDGGAGEPPAYRASILSCTGSTTSLIVTCVSSERGSFRTTGSPMLSANDAFSAMSAVLPAGIMVGGQNTYVTLASSNITNTAGVFGFDVTVQNLIPQALGTND